MNSSYEIPASHLDSLEFTFSCYLKECILVLTCLQTYPGNFDKTSLLTTLFPKAVRARYIRVHPMHRIRGGGMRLEILGVEN